MKKTLITLVALGLLCTLKAQTEFPKMKMVPIQGATKLCKPVLLTNEANTLFVEKMGLAGANIYDIDGDGKYDLLIGEFYNDKKSKNSFIKVFKNIGTNKKPVYANEWKYLKDTEGDNIGITTY